MATMPVAVIDCDGNQRLWLFLFGACFSDHNLCARPTAVYPFWHQQPQINQSSPVQCSVRIVCVPTKMPRKDGEEAAAVSKKNAKNERQMFDSFMDFLGSDLWLASIGQFMEQRSIVFEREPNLSGVPDTAQCYLSVHREFAGMVNELVNGYCQDGGLTREQLMAALKGTDQRQGLSQKERMRLEPIVAAHDFDVFVPMMMRKNIELQLQALKMIEHMKGLLPNSLQLGQEDAEIWDALFGEEESDRLILISVLKQSKEEWEQDQRMRHDWQAQMEAAIRESLQDKQELERMRQREQALLEQALNKADNSSFNFALQNLTIGGPSMKPNNLERINGEAAMPLSAVKLEPKEGPEHSVPTTSSQQQNSSEKPGISMMKPERSENHQGSSPKAVAAFAKFGLSEQPNAIMEKSKASETAIRIKIEQNSLSTTELKEKQKLRRTTSNKGATKDDDNNRTTIEKENSTEKSGEAEAKAKGKDNISNGKRLSLGQLHVPPLRGQPKEEKANNKGDLAYRSLLKDRAGIPEEALQQRMRYLREQRDKLLQKKSREREKQLIEAVKRMDESRPRTAQAARGVMEQRSSAGGETAEEERRRIAAKIRAEVIDKQGQRQ